MGQYITPSTLPPTTYCRRLLIPDSPEWIGTISGALLPLIYASEWQQISGITAEEAAERSFEMLQNYWSSSCGDDPMDNCCVEIATITRVNPDTGAIEISYDNGITWVPKPGTVASQIANPPPPVTSGLVGDKCDAASNIMGQISAWITQVSGDFDTAVTLIEFAFLVAAAIINAILLFLSEGALTLAETEILGIIGAAVGAIWAGGKTLFDDYWSDENKAIILCDILETIPANGNYDDASFSALYAKLTTNMPSGAAKTLFLLFLTSVGYQGVNKMASAAATTGSDCNDCGWCKTFDFTVSDGGFVSFGDGGTWVSGQGWKTVAGSGGQVVDIQRTLDLSTITQFQAVYSFTGTPIPNWGVTYGSETATGGSEPADHTGTSVASLLQFVLGNGGGGDVGTISSITIWGTGAAPSQGDDC